MRTSTTIAALLMLAMPADLSSQQLRRGFWGGYGYVTAGGLPFSCTGCFDSGEWSSDAGALGVVFNGGYALSPRFLAGVGIGFMLAGGDTNTSTVAALAVARYYPLARRPLHLQAGAGVATFSFGRRGGSAEVPAWAAQLGVGYDLRIWRALAATPFAGVTAVRPTGGPIRSFGNVGPVSEARGGTVAQIGLMLSVY